MNKDHFNPHSKQKSCSFIINPFAPAGDMMAKMLAAGSLKNDIEQWVIDQTGCLPSIEICPPEPDSSIETVNIHCTPAFMQKLEAVFADRIAGITRIRTRDEIIEDDLDNGGDGAICWRPPGR